MHQCEEWHPCAVGGEGRRQHLDRHLAAERDVFGQINLTHAAFAELGGDPEVREGCVDQVGGLYCILAGTETSAWVPRTASSWA